MSFGEPEYPFFTLSHDAQITPRGDSPERAHASAAAMCTRTHPPGEETRPAKRSRTAQPKAQAAAGAQAGPAVLAQAAAVVKVEEERAGAGASGKASAAAGGAPAPAAAPPAPAAAEDEDDEEYEVERILGERRRGGRAQFLIRWVGCAPGHARARAYAPPNHQPPPGPLS